MEINQEDRSVKITAPAYTHLALRSLYEKKSIKGLIDELVKEDKKTTNYDKLSK